MHKTKDGKVMASLTEVKNQTGNIFTAADKYGEVYITSYNKIRYRIVREESEDELNIVPRTRRKADMDEEIPAIESKVEFQPEPISEVIEDEIDVIEELAESATPIPVFAEEADFEETDSVLIPEETIEDNYSTYQNDDDTLIEMWDRNNSLERNFARQATRTLLP